MNPNRKCPIPMILSGVAALIFVTTAACYLVIKNESETAPGTIVTNPAHETKKAWSAYDSSGMDASAKDTRFDKDSMNPFSWRNYTLAYPSDWYFEESRYYYAESPMPETAFFASEGEHKLYVTFGSAFFDLSTQDAAVVELGGKTFHRFDNEAGYPVYVFKSGTDNEIFMGTAVQMNFEFGDTEEETIKAILESFALKTDKGGLLTFNMANIALGTNPCTGESEQPTDRATQNAIGDFYGYMATSDYSEAAALLNGDSSSFGSMFALCSAVHGSLAAVAGQNGIILFTMMTNGGFPGIPNDMYHFGYMTASENIVTLREEPIENFFEASAAERYEGIMASDSDNPNSAVRIITEEEARTKREFLAGAFSNPNEQAEYEAFVAEYDSTR